MEHHDLKVGITMLFIQGAATMRTDERVQTLTMTPLATSLLLLPSFRIITTCEFQATTLKRLRLDVLPRTPRHPPTALTHVDLNCRQKILPAKVRPEPVREWTRETKPTRLLWRLSFEVEFVKVVGHGEIERSSGPVYFDAHERRENVEHGHGKGRYEVEIECGRTVSKHVCSLAHDLAARETHALVVVGVPCLHPHVCFRETMCPVLFLVTRRATLMICGWEIFP
jgi:hypothetical protein